mmetsp:Transcript_666/g.1741  ORF Transcript_666/g.1741 Transcript_666/m.1741 type:complete len:241 (+) Transcript_666:242-964(+)
MHAPPPPALGAAAPAKLRRARVAGGTVPRGDTRVGSASFGTGQRATHHAYRQAGGGRGGAAPRRPRSARAHVRERRGSLRICREHRCRRAQIAISRSRRGAHEHGPDRDLAIACELAVGTARCSRGPQARAHVPRERPREPQAPERADRETRWPPVSAERTRWAQRAPHAPWRCRRAARRCQRQQGAAAHAATPCTHRALGGGVECAARPRWDLRADARAVRRGRPVSSNDGACSAPCAA